MAGYVPGPTLDDLPCPISTNPYNFWILERSNIAHEARQTWLVQELQSGTLRCICDGSYKPSQTTQGIAAAWAIEAASSGHKVEGVVAIDGHRGSSYRAELLGVQAVIMALLYVETVNPGYAKGSINIGCDNKLAGRRAGDVNQRVPGSATNADLLRSIRRLQLMLTRTTVNFYHIHGHQDSHLPRHLLTLEAQLNIAVDATAQHYLDECIIQNSFIHQPLFPQEGWSVWLGGIKIQDSISYHIRDWIGRSNLREYLYTRGLIAWTVFDHIDFAPLESYISIQSQSFTLWFTKHWTNFCGIGSKMKIMGFWESDLCPCCKQVPEQSTIHLYRCTHPTITSTRESGFAAILDWLKEVHTAPLLLTLLTAFWHGRAPQLDPQDSMRYRHMYSTMREMGVAFMWMGMLPKQMVEVQTQYYRLIGSRRSGVSWGRDFVGKMLRVTLHLWLERNSLLHLHSRQGINGLHLMELKGLVEAQYALGCDGMEAEDRYLLAMDKGRLLESPEDRIRGWLCNVLIARGEHAAARLECQTDRGNVSHVLPHLSAAQQAEYLDWRMVRIEGLRRDSGRSG